MTNTVLREKSHAGNPHVRFAERLRYSKSLICAMIGAFCIPALFADVFTILPDKAGKWNEATSYAEGRLPALNDTISIGVGVKATANKADIEWLAETLSPTGTISFTGTKTDATSSLTVTIGENEEVDLPCLLTKANDYTVGLVKEGKGLLRITSGDYTPAAAAMDTDYVVKDGILAFKSMDYYQHNNSGNGCNRYFGKITVLAPGILWPFGLKNAISGNCMIENLYGDGVISNATARRVKLRIEQGADANAVFSGSIWKGTTGSDGDIAITVSSGRCQKFTGTSTATCDLSVEGSGIVGLGSFDSATTGGIAIGSGVTINYLGSGETTTKAIAGATSTKTLTLDAGANGGLDYEGALSFADATNPDPTLVLAGDHATAATFGGTIVAPTCEGGSVAIVKRGEGTWNRSIGAGADIPESTVKVESGSFGYNIASNRYEWYRLVVMETYGATAGSVDIARFGLFDENGNAQLPTDMVINTSAYSDLSLLRPGEVAPYSANPNQRVSNFTDSSYSLSLLFLREKNTSFFRITNAEPYPALANEESWVGFAVRVPTGAKTITKYDVGSRWSTGVSASSHARTPISWKLEGSANGIDWHELSTVVSNAVRTGTETCYWLNYTTKTDGSRSYATCTEASYTGHAKGWGPLAADYPRNDALASAEIVQGSALASDLPIKTDKLTFNYTGVGTLTLGGFTLNEGGVIDILTAKKSFAIPLAFSNVALPEAYTILVNGKLPEKTVSFAPDYSSIGTSPSGLMLIFR